MIDAVHTPLESKTVIIYINNDFNTVILKYFSQKGGFWPKSHLLIYSSDAAWAAVLLQHCVPSFQTSIEAGETTGEEQL